MNLILIGFKNAGKSTIGKILAEKIKKTFFDIDQLIEQNYNGLSYFEIYQKEGEKRFRELEKKAVFSLRDVKNAVIATGGGTLLASQNQALLKSIGKLIYLYVEKDVLRERTEATRVPSFLQNGFSETILKRDFIYQKCADHILDVSKIDTEMIVDKVLSIFYGK